MFALEKYNILMLFNHESYDEKLSESIFNVINPQ